MTVERGDCVGQAVGVAGEAVAWNVAKKPRRQRLQTGQNKTAVSRLLYSLPENSNPKTDRALCSRASKSVQREPLVTSGEFPS